MGRMQDQRNRRALEAFGGIPENGGSAGVNRRIRRSEGVPRAPGQAKVCPEVGVGWFWGVSDRFRLRGCQGNFYRHREAMGEVGAARRPWIPAPSPGTPPPARPGLPREGAETVARRGAASVEPPRPRPAAPRLTSPRGPGGAGPRSRVPLQQPPPARS